MDHQIKFYTIMVLLFCLSRAVEKAQRIKMKETLMKILNTSCGIIKENFKAKCVKCMLGVKYIIVISFSAWYRKQQ
jgi:hypothetical protein